MKPKRIYLPFRHDYPSYFSIKSTIRINGRQRALNELFKLERLFNSSDYGRIERFEILSNNGMHLDSWEGTRLEEIWNLFHRWRASQPNWILKRMNVWAVKMVQDKCIWLMKVGELEKANKPSKAAIIALNERDTGVHR